MCCSRFFNHLFSFGRHPGGDVVHSGNDTERFSILIRGIAERGIVSLCSFPFLTVCTVGNDSAMLGAEHATNHGACFLLVDNCWSAVAFVVEDDGGVCSC